MRAHEVRSAARRLSVWRGNTVVDVIVAIALLPVSLGELTASSRDVSPVIAVGSCVVMAGAVAFRRRMPTLAAVGALIGMVGYAWATHDPNLASPPVAVVLTQYTLGRWGTSLRHFLRLVLMAGLGFAATWAVSTQLISAQQKDAPGSAAAFWLTSVIAPFVVGALLARRSQLSQRLEDTAEQLRAEQDHNAAQATAEERNRVARELHDVVAHCVSVMVVQAGAARLVAAHNCADADRALAVIGGCGRDAMADLRRIVGVLRRTDDPGFGRGAGLGDLALLIDRIHGAGVPTQLHIVGTTSPPPAVDVVAYRVVQEALTNVVKHAGEGATATVEVRLGADAVTVEVTNTHVAPRPQFPASGHGLVGMQERVAAYGGDLRVGPRPNDGFGVRAQIPFHPVDPPRAGAVFTSRHQAIRRSRWLSPGIGNAMVVACWFVVMEIEVATSSARHGPWLLNAAAVAMMALAAGWRRRYPLLFLAVIGGLAAAMSGGLTSLDRSTVTGLYSLVVPLFTVSAWEPRTRATVGLALWAAGASIVAVANGAAAGGLAGALMVAIVVWAAGRVWRAQSLLNADLADTTSRLAAERDQRAQLAVATERTRIARDLHGPVAHGVVTMVVRAEAARKLLVHQPGEVEAVIRDIEQTGRDALSQLRRILGVLRSSTDSPVMDLMIDAGTPPASHLGERAARMPERMLT